MSSGANSRFGTYSSSTYRQKAAALMEQIKTDVKTHKRIFSGDSEPPDGITNSQHANTKYRNGQEKSRQTTSHRRKLSKQGAPRSSLVSTCIATGSTEADFTYLQDPRQVIITLTPPTITSSSNIAPQSPSQENQVQQRQATLNPPPHPSIRLGANDDLNRFVSSSTTSGTTLTSGSVPSFVKHPGPAQIRTIAPSDLPTLPERFGDMYFDKDLMKWVKGKAAAAEQSNSRGTEQSDDPFGDFESLRDDSRTEPEYLSSPDTQDDLNAETFLGMTIISEGEDEEEMELSNFSTDVPPRALTDEELQEYEEETTDSESTNDDIHTATQAVINDMDFDSELEDSSCRNNLVLNEADAGPSNINHEAHSPQPLAVVASPAMRANMGTSATATPIIKSVLKSNSVTPTSALKNGTRSRFHTPNNNVHRRSVSFSDGKRDGPMRGSVCYNHRWFLLKIFFSQTLREAVHRFVRDG